MTEIELTSLRNCALASKQAILYTSRELPLRCRSLPVRIGRSRLIFVYHAANNDRRRQ